MSTITIYCDGSSIKNPGPGGWGAVLSTETHIKELGGHEKDTTNNRMELTAALEALQALARASQVTVHTDSQYVISGITRWVKGWEKNGWVNAEKEPVRNKDLWQKLAEAAKRHTITWKHVQAHNGITLNERADMIANGLARGNKIELFAGSPKDYAAFRATLPARRTVNTTSKKKTGKAYSYVSVLNGIVKTHATWAECEARVHGHSFVRFKKALDADDEAKIIKEFSTAEK